MEQIMNMKRKVIKQQNPCTCKGFEKFVAQNGTLSNHLQAFLGRTASLKNLLSGKRKDYKLI